MESEKVLYVVHCIDTEGPLDEDLAATFKRLKDIFGLDIKPSIEALGMLQNCEIDLGGIEKSVSECIAPDLLHYNRNWTDIDLMLDELLSADFRLQQPDDFGQGWVYSWHCMDHVGLTENPRKKDFGYGKIFSHYRKRLMEEGNRADELNWHFHPLSLTRQPLHAATCYVNSYDILTQILCRRIIDDNWFPVVNRPGFHSERPDSHTFLEQWIPFDYANQSGSYNTDQPDLAAHRFGDWSRASRSWRGYHPHHDDYQIEGQCRRWIFRCLNVGTRFRPLLMQDVREAFLEADLTGAAILAFADHDYRDIRRDVRTVRHFLNQTSKMFPEVKIKYSGAHEASIDLLGYSEKPKLQFELSIASNQIIVSVTNGKIFGPQPYLAIKTKDGLYFHDNFDCIKPKEKWIYTLDEQTLPVDSVSKIGVGSAGLYGGFAVEVKVL